MPVSEASRASSRRRPAVAVFILIVLFPGVVGLFRVMDSPRFESFRTLDVIQLLVSGASFGVALCGFMVWLLRPRWDRWFGRPRDESSHDGAPSGGDL